MTSGGSPRRARGEKREARRGTRLEGTCRCTRTRTSTAGRAREKEVSGARGADVRSREAGRRVSTTGRLGRRAGRRGRREDRFALRMDRLGRRADRFVLRMDRLGRRADRFALRMDRLGRRADRFALRMVRSRRSAVHSSSKTVHSLDSAVHSSSRAVHSLRSSVHSSSKTVHSLRSAVHSSSRAVHSLRSSVHSSSKTVHSLSSAVHSSSKTVHSLDSAVHSSSTTVHSLDSAVHSSSKTVHSLDSEDLASSKTVHSSRSADRSDSEVFGRTRRPFRQSRRCFSAPSHPPLRRPGGKTHKSGSGGSLSSTAVSIHARGNGSAPCTRSGASRFRPAPCFPTCWSGLGCFLIPRSRSCSSGLVTRRRCGRRSCVAKETRVSVRIWSLTERQQAAVRETRVSLESDQPSLPAILHAASPVARRKRTTQVRGRVGALGPTRTGDHLFRKQENGCVIQPILRRFVSFRGPDSPLCCHLLPRWLGFGAWASSSGRSATGPRCGKSR